MEAENTLINEEQKLEFVQEGKANVRLCNDDGTFSAFYNPAQVLIFLFYRNSIEIFQYSV